MSVQFGGSCGSCNRVNPAMQPVVNPDLGSVRFGKTTPLTFGIQPLSQDTFQRSIAAAPTEPNKPHFGLLNTVNNLTHNFLTQFQAF